MGFFDSIANLINPKNILTGVGGAVLGPLGAAGGRALGGAVFGNDWKPFDDPLVWGDVVGDAATGAGTFYAGEALGKGFGEALGKKAPDYGMELPELATPTAGAGSSAVSPSLQQAGESALGAVPELASGGGGSFAQGLGNAASSVGGSAAGGGAAAGVSGLEKAALVGQGLSGLGGIYGSAKAGQRAGREMDLAERQMALREEERERRKQLARALAPLFRDMLSNVREQYGMG